MKRQKRDMKPEAVHESSLRINAGTAHERLGSGRANVADAIVVAELNNLAWLLHLVA
ncbi:hypothetical protein ABH900_000318 [Stenotrophomonas sp. AN71]